jgi:hypothetical protein
MKFKWPWQRRAAARKPADPAPGRADDLPPERGWFGSSIDLHDGLKVVEDADVTIPGELAPPDKRRRSGS